MMERAECILNNLFNNYVILNSVNTERERERERETTITWVYIIQIRRKRN